MKSLRHHRALAGGTSTSQLPLFERTRKGFAVAKKLKYHRLKPVVFGFTLVKTNLALFEAADLQRISLTAGG